MSTILQEALDAADEVVAALKAKGIDAQEYRETIAIELFDEGLLEGNYDSSCDIGTHGLRAIQEDEYDQHMEFSDDKPDWNDMLCQTNLSYVWLT
jgi:hypothetical protein